MKISSSILTISKDQSYGLIVKLNYQAQPQKVYCLPSFIGATRAIEQRRLDAIILDFREEDLHASKALLEKLLIIHKVRPEDAPEIFLSQTSSVILHQALAKKATQAFPEAGILQQEALITLERFPVNILIQLLGLAIQPSMDC